MVTPLFWHRPLAHPARVAAVPVRAGCEGLVLVPGDAVGWCFHLWCASRLREQHHFVGVPAASDLRQAPGQRLLPTSSPSRCSSTWWKGALHDGAVPSVLSSERRPATQFTMRCRCLPTPQRRARHQTVLLRCPLLHLGFATMPTATATAWCFRCSGTSSAPSRPPLCSLVWGPLDQQAGAPNLGAHSYYYKGTGESLGAWRFEFWPIITSVGRGNRTCSGTSWPG